MHFINNAFHGWNTTTHKPNMSELELYFLQHPEYQREIDAHIAYFCLVFLICLMLIWMYLLNGFRNRHSNKKDLALLYNEHLPTVNDVVYARAKYLPMFQKHDKMTTIYVHDCGTDP